ncbi:DUF5076 domain-containing protein [Pseudoxanthomonas sp. UC19_8]|uniref:DUF5076 domain-containing protein n=1 Tax=Pseudoxanthomonas sp. UC19_8 TaxID=3350175 RepID=UPI0036D22019
MNERPIPEAALLDEDSVEMMRVWIANKGLHTSLKIGMYREAGNVQEEKAWGRILADAARHIANALEEGYSSNREESLELIRKAFNDQLSEPSTALKGSFVQRH